MNTMPTDCVQYMYDNNGSNKPNKFGMDIAHSDPLTLGVKIPDGKLQNPIGEFNTYLILNTTPGINTCDQKPDLEWDLRGSTNDYCSNNRWAAAKKACIDAGYELPDADTLAKLACRVRGEKTYSAYDCTTRSTVNCDVSIIDTTLKTKLAEKSSSTGYFWSSIPCSSYSALYVHFSNGGIGGYRVNGGSDYRIMCLGKY